MDVAPASEAGALPCSQAGADGLPGQRATGPPVAGVGDLPQRRVRKRVLNYVFMARLIRTISIGMCYMMVGA